MMVAPLLQPDLREVVDPNGIPRIDLPRVVVVGCGFAGLKFIKRLNSRNYQIVLFDKNNFHTFQPLMYQVASSGLEPDSIVYPIRKLFNNKKNFHFRLTDVTNVDMEKKTVSTTIGSIDYDFLVIATGATTNFFKLSNIERFSFTMKSLRESLDLRSIILQNFESALNTTDIKVRERLMNFVIVGAGATGVELAGALAELKKKILPKDYPDLDIRSMQIHVIEAADRVLPSMSSMSSEKALAALKAMDINIWLNTFVQDFDGKKVTTSEGDFFTETLIWSAGVQGNPLNNFESHLNQSKRIETNEIGQIEGRENVFAIGDVASIQTIAEGKGHAMLASVAEQQGRHLAKNLNALAKGKSMTGFRYKDKGTMATIGRNRAVVDLPFISFGGFFAWVVWMFLHLMLLVDFRNRLIVFVNWAWNYVSYDRGLRLIIRKGPNREN
ncbi:MAG: NAD(P)/FAD-dependent oxidoreductase [Bacteroidota bacterium]